MAAGISSGHHRPNNKHQKYCQYSGDQRRKNAFVHKNTPPDCIIAGRGWELPVKTVDAKCIIPKGDPSGIIAEEEKK
jgi:hypothetical protein